MWKKGQNQGHKSGETRESLSKVIASHRAFLLLVNPPPPPNYLLLIPDMKEADLALDRDIPRLVHCEELKFNWKTF